MRVIAGAWRGRKIAAPKGDLTRPTADRTRETLFNMLTSRLGSFDELRVADLFAGSGALGIEALSRGAAHCMFVEQDGDALNAIRTNIAALVPREDVRSRVDVRAGSVLALPAANTPLDLILLDPPYDTGAGAVALDRMLRLGWIGPATWMALETRGDEVVDIAGLAIDAQRNVGKAKLTLLRLAR